jgi:hypothetical protein
VGAGLEIAPLGRTQSEPRRRFALAGGFRLLRLSGIDRLAPAHAAGRGSVGQMPEDLDDHRRIFFSSMILFCTIQVYSGLASPFDLACFALAGGLPEIDIFLPREKFTPGT